MQQKKYPFVTAGAGTLLTLSLALHSGMARAEEGGARAGAAAREPSASTAPSAVTAQDLRIYRDPRTGQIGPPPPGAKPLELSVAEQRMLSRSDQGLPRHTLPGGGVAIDLQGRYRSMAVATVGTGQQAAVSCAVTPSQAEALLQAGEPAASGPEH